MFVSSCDPVSRMAGLSNKPFKLTVGPVTVLAGASAAPEPPAAYSQVVRPT